MAPRSNWKGYLKLSLVSCAVALYPAASTSERVRFNTINRNTGNRVKRQFVDAVTGELVENEDQVKGFETAKGRFLLVEDEELDAIKLESTHTITIESFAPRDSVDERYLDTPYYIAPEDRVGEEAFAVIRETMRRKDRVGIARVVMQRRERILMVEPFEKGLLATTLRFANEVRATDAYFEHINDVPLAEEMLTLGGHIVDQKTAPFDATQFNDRYEDALVEFLKTKQAGEPFQPAAVPEPSNVVNLMDALRRSVETSGREAPKASSPPIAAGSKSPAKSKKAAAAPAKKPATKRSRAR